MTTYGETNTAEVDLTADTETKVLDTTIPSGRGGRIIKILIAMESAVACSGYIELKLGSHAGPYRFPWPGISVFATSGASHNVVEIDVDIEVFASETVKGYLTANSTATDAHIGIIWVA